MKYRRYQLKKEGVAVIRKHHPWIFRSHLSTAALTFKTGEKLKLVDEQNEPIAYGVFDAEGVIAIRVLKFGATQPSTDWFEKQISKALKKRDDLKKYTDSYRILHGENDGLPAIVLELYKHTLILQVYSASMDSIGRYAALKVARELGIPNILLKEPQKRFGKERTTDRKVRVLRGTLRQKIRIREGKTEFCVDIAHGQKSGTFLDLRGLRKILFNMDLKGKRVLNLFSYTGTLGLMAEQAGAKQIWNVDIAKAALDFARRYHTKDEKRHQFIEADIFHWLEALGPHELFDLIIVDPPNMGTKKAQVPQILKTYEKLYRLSMKHLTVSGRIIVCCCTSRIHRREFARAADRTLRNMKCLKELNPEEDHPVTFPEGDYLKIRLYAPQPRG